MLEIRLLGQFDVRLDGQPVEIPSRPAQSLLAYLALTAGAPHRRERLAGLLWPDAAESNARSNLRHALWRLRAAIEKNAQYLLTDALTVAFNAEADYWLDAAVVQQEFSGDWPTEELMDAASVYNGELLPGFYDEWVGPERERLAAAFERQMQKLLDRLTAEERWAEVLAWGEHWIALGGVPEPAYRALMTGYSGLGDKAGVAITYQRCVEALQNELGVEPAAQTRALFERLSRSEPPPAPTVAPTQPVAPTPAHNLPAQSTPFIGRGETLAEIARLMNDPACRLLTLTGPGGIGKTRLALQAAAETLNKRQFADGVFFVPLAPLGSADFIVPAIASAIAFTFYGGLDPKEQLLNHLREKNLLLVMDNFEHLVEGSELLSELLESAPGLKFLITSRERLNLRGEWLTEVQGMSVPENYRNGIEGYSAMQLFLQSARRVHPGFRLADDDKPHAVHICRLVEGLPLAIELASAWVRAISLHEIAKEIERNLDLLATTLRDVPERHRSLRAVFDHSWNRLNAEEKRVFRNLSVFRGGFQREAAEEVAGASLPVLSALMDKSLLRRMPSGRYEIHELLRQYARDKLVEAGEEIQVRNRHLACFLSLAEEADPMLRRAEQLTGLSRLETEHDNLRAALQWAATDEQLEEGLRLAGSLARFWYLHGYWSEGRERLTTLLKISEGDGGAQRPLLRARAKALYGAAWLEDESGDDEPLYEQSLALCREIGDKWGAAFSLRGLGSLAITRGEKAAAAAFLGESLTLFEELNDGWGKALVKFNLGWLADAQDKHDEKASRWNESLAGFREIGDRWGMAVTLGALSYSARFRGDYKAASTMSKESLQLFKELDDKAGMAESLARLASVAYRRSDYKQALEMYEESLTLQKELGDHLGVVQAKSLLGLVAAYQGDYERATELLEESLRNGEELAGREGVAYIISYLATAAYFQGNLERASALWEETLAIYRQFDDHVSLAYSVNYLGLAALHRGDLERAAALLREAHDLILSTIDKRGLALALYGLGRLAYVQGDDAHAISLFKQCLILRQEMGDKQGIAESLECLAGALGRCGEKGAVGAAARLLGAAEHLREKIGSPLPPVERGAYQRDAAAIRSLLGDEGFSAAWAAGREMGLEAALAEALA